MSASRSADIVICGAGIGGVAAAYELAVRRGLGMSQRIVLVDPLPPLTLTSDKSTECYRNWWPGPGTTMVRFMDRSIDLLEEMAEASGDRFAMNRNGYAYFTAEPERAAGLERAAREISALGAGDLRIHRGEMSDPLFPEAPYDKLDPSIGGADLILDPQTIRCRYPFLNPATIAALLPRRCGWLAAQQLGMWMLEQARDAGVELVEGRLTEVTVESGRVTGVEVAGPTGAVDRIATGTLVNAAGPLAPEIGRLAGLELPLFNELHGKVYLEDTEQVVPRELPLMIWCDPVTLDWGEEERAGAGDPISPISPAAPRRRPLPARGRPRQPHAPAALHLPPRRAHSGLAAEVRSLVPGGGAARRRPHGARLRGLPRWPDAALVRRRRLLLQDGRESPAGGPDAGRRLPPDVRTLRLRHHGGGRRCRAPGGEPHGRSDARLRRRVPPRSLR
jgi:glycine/D-amino acid oxidase-like deaminating enzyme